MANIKISELNELTQKANNDYVPIVDTSADETKKISVKDLIPSNVTLLAVSSTEPEECYTGDKYFNTTTNLIYTAIERNVWSTTGEQAQMGINYIVFDTQTVYAYDGTTLVSVGGGAGGGDSTPIGTIEGYTGNIAPDGYLLCDGSAISRTTYSDLFNVIGTTYGSGDGSTTFNLPNIKGKVVVGKDGNDTAFDTLGETGGSKNAVVVQHQHEGLRWIGNDNYPISLNAGSVSSGYQLQYNSTANPFNQGTINTALAGESGTNKNLQPYIVLNYIIKATKVTPTQAQVVNTYSESTENAYSCDYINGTELWTNSNPTNDFEAQNIQVNFKGYRKYEIIYYSSKGDTLVHTTGKLPIGIGSGTKLTMMYNAQSNAFMTSRQVDIISNGLGFYNAYFYSLTGGGEGNANNRLIPLQIIGYK